MRWSLFSLVALLAVLIADVTALPTPQDGSSDLVLERRARTRPSVAKKAKLGSSLKASTFKKSSSTYRNAALKSKNPIFSVKSGRITKSKAPKKMPKGWDADHIFEAQTMKHAAQKAGHSKTSLAPAMKAVKDRINHPNNMAFLDPATNKAKGKAHTAVQSGKTPAKDRNVADYLKHTSAAGKSTAADLDKILKTHGIKGINVSKEHKKVLKAHGVKRREYSDVDLD
jgi:hypothetical protein